MDNKIKKAKQVPITTLYKGTLKQTGKSLIGQCPFHEDMVASFVVYPATNTYFCFGGCKYGDSIQFYMKLHKLSFVEAVREMGK